MTQSGVELITAERKRQIEVEKWSTTHDDEEHWDGELAMAGACYAMAEQYRESGIIEEGETPADWPGMTGGGSRCQKIESANSSKPAHSSPPKSTASREGTSPNHDPKIATRLTQGTQPCQQRRA